MKETKQILGGGEWGRDAFGCIVTFENDTRHRLTLHRTSPPIEALRAMCAIALARDETFQVISYSTPQTIFSDMQGSRENSAYGFKTEPTLPEAQALARADMRAMLKPQLKPRAA